MYENIIEIKGKNQGPTSIILAGIHGDEKCGIEAFNKLIPNLEIQNGTVIFMFGNPNAIKQNVRYTQTNLNRMFKDEKFITSEEKTSYEYKRAQQLKEYLNKADALLDIHSTSIVGSKSFAICEANAKDIVKFLPVDLVVAGFDDIEPGGTDYYMNKNGKIGICVECGYTNDPKASKLAEESILNFLKAQNHNPNTLQLVNQDYIRMFEIYITKTSTFKLIKAFENFETVKKDQTIGFDGIEKIKASKDCVILFAHNCQKINDEAFLLGEKIESLA